MCRKQRPVSVGILVMASAIAVEQGFVINPKWYLLLLVTLPLLVACFLPVRK